MSAAKAVARIGSLLETNNIFFLLFFAELEGEVRPRTLYRFCGVYKTTRKNASPAHTFFVEIPEVATFCTVPPNRTLAHLQPGRGRLGICWRIGVARRRSNAGVTASTRLLKLKIRWGGLAGCGEMKRAGEECVPTRTGTFPSDALLRPSTWSSVFWDSLYWGDLSLG